MITLIGTGHVFNLSQALLDIFEEKQPEVLCVELDKQRYNALMLKRSDPDAYKKHEKNVPILYKLLARFQEGMANEYGVTAGAEMLTTIDFARNHQLPLTFIDMNAQNLFKKMLKKMTLKEKIKLMFSGLAGFFVNKKHVEKELKKIDKDFDKYIEQIGEKFPTIKSILIDERDKFMVQHLSTANEQYGKIIAVVGDGHIPGLSRLLDKKEIDYETIRLGELRNHKPVEHDGSTASFSMEYKEI
jgi:pheromone shutdown protein TraB